MKLYLLDIRLVLKDIHAVFDVRRRTFMISRDVQFLEEKFHDFGNTKNDFEQQERSEIPDDGKQTIELFNPNEVDHELDQTVNEN